MLLLPITSANNKINNGSFKGKDINIERLLSSQKFHEQLSKIKTDKDAKNILLSLSVLAGSVFAELTSITEKFPEIKDFADKILNNLGFKDKDVLHDEMKELFSSTLDDTKKEKNVDYTPLVEENPKRTRFLSILSNYSNLNEKYREMLDTRVLDPDNMENKLTLETLELAFDLMSKDDRLPYYESYFKEINSKYCDCLDDIATNILSAYKSGYDPLGYLQLINSCRLSPKDVHKWAVAKNLGYEEFIKSKSVEEEILQRVSELKTKNKNFKINYIKPFDNFDERIYTFKLKFKNGISVEDKLKAAADVHTAIYGSISLKDETDIIAHYLNSDIRTELADNILKDRRINSVYSFVKYINPEAFGDINLTSQQVKFLTKDDEMYKKIKQICSKEVMSMNPENPKLFELYELLQNDDVFGNLLKTTHARLRFITRFVLRNNQNPSSLLYKSKAKVDTLRKELDANLHKYSFICYVNKRGYAPQFFHRETKLGNYVRITLNSSGNIHTIYEDVNRELKDAEQKKEI